jgi:putative thiamine transport system permease protein
LIVGLPVIAGLAGTLLPAFGFLPSLGGREFSLTSWRALFDSPWFFDALRLSVTTGLVATFVSLTLALAIVMSLHSSAAFARIERMLAPILATPHVALAIGFAFLIAPSGWIARLVSPWLTGWETPPDIATVGDRNGIALIAGLVLKEVPYLVLMTLAALNQIPARAQLAIARSLGYSHASAWVRIVLPQILPQMRLPLFAVLAFSLSNVDVAILLGPSNPSTLAVQVLRAYSDYDLRNYFPASAGAICLLALVVASGALYVLVERLALRGLRALATKGVRTRAWDAFEQVARFAILAIFALALFSWAIIVIWSLTEQWQFSDKVPNSLRLDRWSRLSSQWIEPFLNSLSIAIAVTLIAALTVVLTLEFESPQRRVKKSWLYAPLVVPQIAFLFGVQVLAVRFGIDGRWWTVVWMHLVFAIPYLYLSLLEPWHAIDPRYARAARSLGAGRWRVLWQIKLPLALRPLAIACAVAFAVSIGQYVATIFAGSGRIATVTTEAITLSSGGDRRILAVYAVLQMSLPFAAYLLAHFVPKLRFRNRRLMQLSS